MTVLRPGRQRSTTSRTFTAPSSTVGVSGITWPGLGRVTAPNASGWRPYVRLTRKSVPETRVTVGDGRNREPGFGRSVMCAARRWGVRPQGTDGGGVKSVASVYAAEGRSLVRAERVGELPVLRGAPIARGRETTFSEIVKARRYAEVDFHVCRSSGQAALGAYAAMGGGSASGLSCCPFSAEEGIGAGHMPQVRSNCGLPCIVRATLWWAARDLIPWHRENGSILCQWQVARWRWLAVMNSPW
jgi:hypothetical protein